MRRICNILFVCAISSSLSAQELNHGTFIKRVKENNISFIAEKYNIDIADANIQAARGFNDPELSFSYSNNQDKKMQMGQSYEGELGYEFSLGNVRSAKIGVAKAEKELANAAVADYFRNLKAEASLHYLEALKLKEAVGLMRSSYLQMQELAVGDSLRCALGEITSTDAMQSRLEAQTMYNELLQAEADFRNALTELAVLMGEPQLQIDDTLADKLSFDEKDFILQDLYSKAEENRADLHAAISSKTLSEKNLRLVKAGRAPELGLSLGFVHNTIVNNEIAPAPAHNGVSVGVAIPLKFSSMNKGEVRAARLAVHQSEAALDAARLQIRNEVTQAYNNYMAACDIAKRFQQSMLADAAEILKNKTFGYQRGETSLLEVLNARRTYNDICLSYYEALCNASSALVELQRAIGN